MKELRVKVWTEPHAEPGCVSVFAVVAAIGHNAVYADDDGCPLSELSEGVAWVIREIRAQYPTRTLCITSDEPAVKAALVQLAFEELKASFDKASEALQELTAVVVLQAKEGR